MVVKDIGDEYPDLFAIIGGKLRYYPQLVVNLSYLIYDGKSSCRYCEIPVLLDTTVLIGIYMVGDMMKRLQVNIAGHTAYCISEMPDS